jgi:hypothetical protein
MRAHGERRGRHASRCVAGVGCTSPGGKITGVNCVAILHARQRSSGRALVFQGQQLQAVDFCWPLS